MSTITSKNIRPVKIQLRFFAVGLSFIQDDLSKRGKPCPDGDCSVRGRIPPDKYGDQDGARGFKTATGTLQPQLAAASAVDFETEAAANAWLSTKDGEEFIDSFQSVIVVRSSTI